MKARVRLVAAVLITFGCGRAAAQDGGAAGGGEGGAPTFALGVEPYGRAPYPLSSRGARLAVGLAPDASLELTVVEAKTTVLLADFEQREYGLRYSYWLGSKVFAGVGAGVRDIRIAYEAFVAEEGSATSIEERHRALTLTAHVGVEFQPLPFLALGADLVGVSYPAHWVRHEDGFPEDAAGFEEDPKDVYLASAFAASQHLLRTYVAIRY